MAKYIIDNIASAINFQMDDPLLRTAQNAKNLLMLRRGEIPYDRERGFDQALYELPILELNDNLIPELERLMEWEPDAEVVSAEASLLDNGQVYIQVEIEVNGVDEDEDEENEEQEDND